MTANDIITEARLRLGDNNSASYFADDTIMAALVRAAVNKLPKYAMCEDEETIAGDGVKTYFDIPAGAITSRRPKIYIRLNDDPTTDSTLRGYRIHAGKIYLNNTIDSSTKIVFWTRRAYTLSDTIPNDALEILYMLVEKEWYRYAIAKRSDYEQWAATNRSDMSVAQIVSALRAVIDELDSMKLGDGPQVYDLSEYE